MERDKGQSREPLPPQSITGTKIFIIKLNQSEMTAKFSQIIKKI
jgi:hypothetical protein